MVIFFEKDISSDFVEKNLNFLKNFKFIDFNFGNDLLGVLLLEEVSIDYINNNLVGLKKILNINTPYKFVSREFKSEDTIINIDGFKIGGENFQKIGGPCSFESEEVFRNIVFNLKKNGVNIIRGGAFKPRTSPYFFQGIGEQALKSMRKVADEFGVKIVSEIVSIEHLEYFNKYVDIIQIGARNMQNFELIKEVGKCKKPILLKRGLSATVEEFLLSAEYIACNGNLDIILCERGIRTFNNMTRNTLDVAIVPLIKKLSHLPIIIDPSHASGMFDLVEPLALAGVSAGCHGVMVEVHNDPEKALSDGLQSIKFKRFEEMSKKIDIIREVLFK